MKLQAMAFIMTLTKVMFIKEFGWKMSLQAKVNKNFPMDLTIKVNSKTE